MTTTQSSRRFRVLTLLLSVLLAVGTLVPAVGAGMPGAALAAQDAPGGQAANLRALGPLQEAYDLLLDRYALPLDPATLSSAAQTSMEEALKEAGVTSVAPGLGVVGNDRTQQLTALRQRFTALAGRYGGVVPPNELAYAAIKGMAESTDDSHTNFMTPDQYQEHLAWTRGDVSYGGIGARMRGPQATVLEVFRGSPAERAGLHPGDTIVGVDGRNVGDLRLDEVINLVRGPEVRPSRWTSSARPASWWRSWKWSAPWWRCPSSTHGDCPATSATSSYAGSPSRRSSTASSRQFWASSVKACGALSSTCAATPAAASTSARDCSRGSSPTGRSISPSIGAGGRRR